MDLTSTEHYRLARTLLRVAGHILRNLSTSQLAKELQREEAAVLIYRARCHRESARRIRKVTNEPA